MKKETKHLRMKPCVLFNIYILKTKQSNEQKELHIFFS